MIALDAVRTSVAFTPGQFIVLAFGGPTGWERHPFSISSAPSDRRLEVTVKASGDYTGAPRGCAAGRRTGEGGRAVRRLRLSPGGPEQIWIAGGIGVTPFMSWLRSLDDAFDRDVEFFYSVREPGEAVYRDEIEAAVERHPSIRTHFVFTDTDPMLTAEDVLLSVPAGSAPWIYMSGPRR